MPLNIKVGTEAECEAAEYVVCCRWSVPSVFTNDQRGTCCACGEAVRYRPYMPKKPAKICFECWVATLKPH